MKKYILTVVAIVIAFVSVFVWNKDPQKVDAHVVPSTSFLNASSTAFTLTTTSLRLLGTTTPQGQSGARVTATIQPINCTIGGTNGVFLRLERDVVATANTGTFAFASSTTILGDVVNQFPNVRGAVQGIVGSGTCTVLVTEWRTQ